MLQPTLHEKVEHWTRNLKITNYNCHCYKWLVTAQQSIERTNNSSIDAYMVCATVSGGYFASSCDNGDCGSYLYDPRPCCSFTPGNCISPAGVHHGICSSACDWYDH